ncbi:alpha/beta-hydrolase [Annulohypoxylon truncatum]|uniref:alpha/beta-hydrolase n=1 Tax=Annulohypoxylon truncatum TaxID=327061 RepID=UPI002008D28A|nr:alpha/beta-hydrolase [Annulohypoxylon truncatum]KAI1211646.1 alpha/beta-hydrolase [Annulohypoxylon truncatum]
MTDDTKTNSSALHRREVFYVGGQYVPDAKGNRTLQGQMYVERLIPEVDQSLRKPLPIVFIHGATRSGMDWITKPDGQPGWTSYFLSQGFECYLVDQPYRGRSPWYPGNGTMVAYTAESIQAVFTACQTFGTWPQAKQHTQWPGPGTIGDPVFDQFYRSALQILNDTVAQERASQAACAALLDRIGRPAVLVGHSAGGSVPWLTADARPGLVQMIVALEPVGPPFSKMGIMPGPGAQYGVTTAPITYDPPVTDPATDFAKVEVKAPGPDLTSCTLQAEEPPPRQLVNLRDVRVLVVTAPASYHVQYDWGTVQYLRQAGVKNLEYMRLDEKGIHGNGHMMMMEKNSDEIAAEIVRWINGATG